jgi:iron complex transport system substrate-binding protein
LRIVAHSCSNTEIVCALGCGELLVGVDDHSDFPPDVLRDVPRVGPDLHLDIDRVVALKPDLVIASLTVPGHERNADALVAAGLNVLILEPTQLSCIPADVRTIARALSVDGRGEALATELEQAFQAQSPPKRRSRVLVEWWPKPVIVPGRQSWVTDLLDLAGGVNPFADRDVKSLPITDEEAIEAAPDVCVASWCGVPDYKVDPGRILRRRGWGAIPAVRDRRCVAIPEAYLGRPGPRLVEGLRRLREAIAQDFSGIEV